MDPSNHASVNAGPSLEFRHQMAALTKALHTLALEAGGVPGGGLNSEPVGKLFTQFIVSKERSGRSHRYTRQLHHSAGHFAAAHRGPAGFARHAAAHRGVAQVRAVGRAHAARLPFGRADVSQFRRAARSLGAQSGHGD